MKNMGLYGMSAEVISWTRWADSHFRKSQRAAEVEHSLPGVEALPADDDRGVVVSAYRDALLEVRSQACYYRHEEIVCLISRARD